MTSIRQFRWDDYEAVAAVWAAAGREVVSRAELAAKLTRDPELFLVADASGGGDDGGSGDDGGAGGGDGGGDGGDAVVGVVMGTYDGRRGWILRLAVHPGSRRRGIASHLVRELEHRLRQLGCPRVNLLVMPDNDSGLRFWRALGYLPMPDVLCTRPL